MSPELAFAIETGIVSGILTAVMIWLVRQFIIKIISPKLEQYFYNGVLLDGTWNATVKEQPITIGNTTHTQERILTINLYQKGNKLKGTFYARSTSEKNEAGVTEEKDKNIKEYSNQYKIQGNIIDNYAILNYRALSRNRTGLGSLVLQVVYGGTKLTGGISYIGEGSETVFSIDEVSFIRST